MLFSCILILILQNLVEKKLFLVDVTEPVLKRKYIALQKKVLVPDILGPLQFAEYSDQTTCSCKAQVTNAGYCFIDK